MRSAVLLLLFTACAASASAPAVPAPSPPAAPATLPASSPPKSSPPTPASAASVEPTARPDAETPADPSSRPDASPHAGLRLHGDLGAGDVAPVAEAGSGAEPHVPGPTVGLGPMRVPPGMSDAERVIAALRPGFRRCYARALEHDPNAAGVTNLDVKLGPGGEVTDVVTKGHGALSPDLVKCIARLVQAVRFSQPPNGGATLGIPLTFAR